MSDKEIFIEKEEFEKAIEKLKGYKMVLIDKRNRLIKKMKRCHKTGGNAVEWHLRYQLM